MRLTPDLHKTHEVHTLLPSLAVIVSISSSVQRKRERGRKKKQRSRRKQTHKTDLTVFRVRVFFLQLHSHTLLGSWLLIRS